MSDIWRNVSFGAWKNKPEFNSKDPLTSIKGIISFGKACGFIDKQSDHLQFVVRGVFNEDQRVLMGWDDANPRNCNF